LTAVTTGLAGGWLAYTGEVQSMESETDANREVPRFEKLTDSKSSGIREAQGFEKFPDSLELNR